MDENEIYLSKFSGEEIDAKLEMISNFIQKINSDILEGRPWHRILRHFNYILI